MLLFVRSTTFLASIIVFSLLHTQPALAQNPANNLLPDAPNVSSQTVSNPTPIGIDFRNAVTLPPFRFNKSYHNTLFRSIPPEQSWGFTLEYRTFRTMERLHMRPIADVMRASLERKLEKQQRKFSFVTR